ncbi:hypothetical protein SMACR_04702 [Sordaria macrospora]|uniref:WGS project CABT00000000 data, contig 2.21 n=2 Tax=Sordaria macrospora TaxID=5147 RepID=F7W270_SORMK|nr:uncharacterized protein SMAC_04702 [Sordaria macrospora k-hell]KAA8632284.1 hypothetical protein SMACR_04702 [Sordaria macrospora]WPJ61975.1 hypothetical protein SMAC4_04702 [Sordaria macrospora]CCC11720.1 unnamed protein product [Sordaria macrospora k-hell]
MDILSPTFRFPGPSPANSQVVRTWLALLHVWRTVDRPTTWNGQVFHAIPSYSSPSSRAPQIHFDAHSRIRTTGTSTNNTTATTTIHNYTITQLLCSSRFWSLFLRPLLLALFLSPLIFFASIANRLSGINATPSHTPPFLPPWLPFLAIPYIILIFLSCCSGLAFVHVLILRWGKPVIWSFNRLSEKELNEKEEEYEARNALVAVVRALRERNATVVRDKSFAMMCILERLEILLKPADSQKSLGEVYHEVFAGLLRRESALIALLVDVDGIKETRRAAEESENFLEGAPSWVPSWSQLPKRHWINYDESIYKRIQLGTSPSSPATTSVSAHGAQSQDWRLCWIDHGQNDRALIVQAVILCRITYVSSQIGSSEFRFRSTQETISIQHLRSSLTTIDAWLYAITLFAPSTPPHQFNPTAIHMTLYPFNQQAPMTKPNTHNGHQEGCGRVASHFRRWNYILNGPQSAYMYSPEQRQQLIDKVLQDPELRTFAHNVCERLGGDTRLYISQDDGFVGEGSKRMERGDVVALIRGVGQPMILRQTTSQKSGSGSFTVVGPAFACRLADLNTFRSTPGPGPEGGSGPGAYDPERDGKVWRVLSLV